jgi:hypothetical protein
VTCERQQQQQPISIKLKGQKHLTASLERKTLLSGEKLRELRSGDGEVSLFGLWWLQTTWLAQTEEMVEDSWCNESVNFLDVVAENATVL